MLFFSRWPIGNGARAHTRLGRRLLPIVARSWPHVAVGPEPFGASQPSVGVGLTSIIDHPRKRDI
jgi:hypothetical protein